MQVAPPDTSVGPQPGKQNTPQTLEVPWKPEEQTRHDHDDRPGCGRLHDIGAGIPGAQTSMECEDGLHQATALFLCPQDVECARVNGYPIELSAGLDEDLRRAPYRGGWLIPIERGSRQRSQG